MRPRRKPLSKERASCPRWVSKGAKPQNPQICWLVQGVQGVKPTQHANLQSRAIASGRNDTGASCYISPMLAEQAGLDRSSAGRELIATLSPNTDDHGGTPTATTPWRVMAWGGVHLPPVQGASRADLEDVLRHIDQLKSRVELALSRIT